MTPWGVARRVYEEAPGIWCVDTDTDGGYWLSTLRRDQLPSDWSWEAGYACRAVERVAEEATMRVLFDLGGAQGDQRIRASMDALARAFPHAAFAHNWRLVQGALHQLESADATVLASQQPTGNGSRRRGGDTKLP